MVDASRRNSRLHRHVARAGPTFVVKQAGARSAARRWRTRPPSCARWRRAPELRGHGAGGRPRGPRGGRLVLRTPAGAPRLERPSRRAASRAPGARPRPRARRPARAPDRRVADAARRSDRLWGLSLPEPPHELLLELSAGALDLLARVQASRARVRPAAASCATRPTADAFVHGDLRWDNCLAVAAPGARRRTRVAAGGLGARRARAGELRRRHGAGGVPARVGRLDPDPSTPARPEPARATTRDIRSRHAAGDPRASGPPTGRARRSRRRCARVIELTAVRLLQTAIERAQRSSADVRRMWSSLVQVADEPASQSRGRGARTCWGCTRERRTANRSPLRSGRDDPRPDRATRGSAVRSRRSRAAARGRDGRRRARRLPRRRVSARSSYWSFYCRGRAGRRRAGRARAGRARTRGSARRCRMPTPVAAAGSRAGRSSALDGGEAVVTSPACARESRSPTAAPPAALAPGRGGQRPRAEGASVAVTRASTRRSAMRRRRRIAGGVLRVYWHVDHAGAPALVRALTSRLNAARGAVPAEGRRPSVPLRPLRRGGPVPAGRDASTPVRATLARGRGEHRRRTCGRRSPRSRSRSRPASGSPRTTAAATASARAAARCSPRRSCALTARCHAAGARVDVVAECFAADGVDDRRPIPRAVASPAAMSSDGAFLDAASAIGRRIVDDAVWHDGRCSWIGAAADAQAAVAARVPRARARPCTTARRASACSSRNSPRSPARRRRAPDRGGRASPRRRARAAAGAGRARRAARGRRSASRWAAARGRSTRPSSTRGARALRGRRRPARRARPLPRRRHRAAPARSSRCSRSPRHSTTRARAARDRGRRRAARRGATVTPHGWSWAEPGRRYPHHLCGLAHGAGGIGWALLELSAATGDERFRAAASGAFAYERSWLDADVGDVAGPPHRRPASRPRAHGDLGRRPARGATARPASR